MTPSQLIDQLATDAYVHISGVAKYPATIIYKANIQQLKDICEAYHQAKCAESEPVGEVRCDARTGHVYGVFWYEGCTPSIGANVYLDPPNLIGTTVKGE